MLRSVKQQHEALLLESSVLQSTLYDLNSLNEMLRHDEAPNAFKSEVEATVRWVAETHADARLNAAADDTLEALLDALLLEGVGGDGVAHLSPLAVSAHAGVAVAALQRVATPSTILACDARLVALEEAAGAVERKATLAAAVSPLRRGAAVERRILQRLADAAHDPLHLADGGEAQGGARPEGDIHPGRGEGHLGGPREHGQLAGPGEHAGATRR